MLAREGAWHREYSGMAEKYMLYIGRWVGTQRGMVAGMSCPRQEKEPNLPLLPS